MWLNMFGYILFQAWRKYQDSRLIHRLDEFKSFKELETAQSNIISFNSFLYQLCKGKDKVTAQLYRSLMPGLGETIDRVAQRSRSSMPATTHAISKFAHGISKVSSSNVIQHFIDPSHYLCKKRLDNTLIHLPVKCKLAAICLFDMLYLHLL